VRRTLPGNVSVLAAMLRLCQRQVRTFGIEDAEKSWWQAQAATASDQYQQCKAVISADTKSAFSKGTQTFSRISSHHL